LLLAGIWWNRDSYRLIRNWRLLLLPFFSAAVLYCFAFYYVRGLLVGRALVTLDNKMN
jgi:hypothetical protein